MNMSADRFTDSLQKGNSSRLGPHRAHRGRTLRQYHLRQLPASGSRGRCEESKLMPVVRCSQFAISLARPSAL
jgi:hypothetical protein